MSRPVSAASSGPARARLRARVPGCSAHGGLVEGLQAAAAQEALGFPAHVALAAVLPIGHPRRRLTKLSRLPVADLLHFERWDDPES